MVSSSEQAKKDFARRQRGTSQKDRKLLKVKVGREIKVLFKAKGTFRGSKPSPNSPYPTATPFYSNAVLGQQIWPAGTSLEYLHHRLSTSLNDRHNRIGIIGDWRETHDPHYGGFASFHYQEFEVIKVPGQKPQYRNIREEVWESGN